MSVGRTILRTWFNFPTYRYHLPSRLFMIVIESHADGGVHRSAKRAQFGYPRHTQWSVQNICQYLKP